MPTRLATVVRPACSMTSSTLAAFRPWEHASHTRWFLAGRPG
ncbi:MAG: hypothetical protein ACRDPY_23655 [Streptosporangiaceae bacterium]